MIRVNIVDLKTGMVLAQPVRNDQGVLLLDAGTKITKKNIRIFKSWGVSEVTVERELKELRTVAETSVAGENNSIEIALKEKFTDVLDDPVMVEIFNAANKQLIKKSLKIENEKDNSRP